jgi:glucose-1-phosphate adenylyltransferase
MRDVLTIILGGGQGARLWPLTRYRAKPAVPVAGNFRLIDVPISNALHAGLNEIYVLTQFNSESLHRHIARTYRFDAFSSGFVNILAAEQSVENRDWYQGTADAVRKHIGRLTETGASDAIILSGDQLYLMDLVGFLAQHRESGADLTIAVTPVDAAVAPDLGLMRMDSDRRIVEFVEKPQDPDVIDRMKVSSTTAETTSAPTGSVLASMGIYAFKLEALMDILDSNDGDDFGRDLIPHAVGNRPVSGFVHDGYWRDIGTISSFHEASIELTQRLPALNLYDPAFPIYTHPRYLPGSKVTDCKIYESVLADGAIVQGSELTSSIIGVRGVVRSGTKIEHSVIMGANHFEDETPEGAIPLGVGHNCHIRNAIVDMDVRIGDGCQLVNAEGQHHADTEHWSIRDGIIVVPKGAVIPPGTVV